MKNGFNLYLNKKEKELLAQKALAFNLSQSAFLREIINNFDYLKDRENFKEYILINKELLKYFRAISNNINQIAYQLNARMYKDPKIVLKEIETLKIILKKYKENSLRLLQPKLLKEGVKN